MGGLNIKLPSDHQSYLDWSKETSLVLESQDPVTPISQQEKICTKIKKLKTDKTNRKKTILMNSLDETDIYMQSTWPLKREPLTGSTLYH